jgi:uncharacterized protein (TIGR00369 family)
MTPELIDDRRCFACGPHNAEGLHMEFRADGDDGARAEVTLPPRMQGFRGIAHGGVVMMLLDEVMAHACRFVGQKAMTASAEVRFRRPVPLGETLYLYGRFKERRRNVLFLEASIALADGVPLATAEGTFVSAGPYP